jgi:hypothetical protein
VTTLAQYLAAGCKKYGYQITPLEYRALYAAQGGRCYVCRRASGKAKRLGVDHDHLTGEVRGLLCTGSLSANTCNRLIAIYNRAQLLRAVEMLTDPPPARRVLVSMRAGAEYVVSLVDGHLIKLSELGGTDGEE